MIDYCLIAIISLAAAAYAVFGGADFGAGVWEINNRLRTSKQDRKLIYRAIGPVWEANHVWLIFAIIAVWTCYPPEFQQLCVVGSFLLAVALVGIVLRGAAYAFRSSGQPGKRGWEIVFAFASTLTPFCFGCLTAVLSNDALPRFGQGDRNPMTDWISFPSLYFGFFAVGICAYLASIFLLREVRSTSPEERAQLEPRWRKNALRMSWLVGAFAIGGLAMTAIYFSTVWQGILQIGWPAVAAGVTCGAATIFAIRGRRYWLASATATLTVSFVLVAWVLGQIQSGHNFGIEFRPANPKTENVRWLLFGCMLGGMILIAPPLIWLFYIFKSSNAVGKPETRA